MCVNGVFYFYVKGFKFIRGRGMSGFGIFDVVRMIFMKINCNDLD